MTGVTMDAQAEGTSGVPGGGVHWSGGAVSLAAALRPWVEAGLLRERDAHAVALPLLRADEAAWLADGAGAASAGTGSAGTGSDAGEALGDVADALLAPLAMALAVRQTLGGHAFVDLERPPAPPAWGKPEVLPPWPDAASWRDSVAGSALVEVISGGERLAVREARPYVLHGSRLYLRRYACHEQQVARRLAALAGPAQGMEELDAALARRGLDVLFGAGSEGSRQRLAAATALLGQLLVLTGGPGMGKTWTVRNLLVLLYAQHESARGVGRVADRPLHVTLAAPTGKAAARVRESLLAGLDDLTGALAGALPGDVPVDGLVAWLRGLEAKTLHRTLGYSPVNGGVFRKGPQDPVQTDVLVIDEVSMVDLPMMARLLDAVAAGTKVVLIGDPNQLASVEVGTVLADVVAQEDPRVAQRSAPVAAASSTSFTVQSQARLTALTSSRTSGSAHATRLLTPSRPLSTVAGSSDRLRACASSRAISLPSRARTIGKVGSRYISMLFSSIFPPILM